MITLLLTFASVVTVGIIGREALVYFLRQWNLRRRAHFFGERHDW